MVKHWWGISSYTKGLMGQVEGLVCKFPTTLFGKNALLSLEDSGTQQEASVPRWVHCENYPKIENASA